VFTQITYDLTVGTGAGGTTDPVPGVYSHPCGSSVDITAIPDAGHRFDHWVLDGSPAGSANPISVLMNDNHDLEPVFAEIHKLIITVSEGGTTDPSPGTYAYETSTSVIVKAIPFTNYRFDHWEFDGENIGSETPVSVYVGSTHTLKAVFEYSAPPVGGYSVSLAKQVIKAPLICYTMLLAIFSAIISLIKRKRK